MPAPTADNAASNAASNASSSAANLAQQTELYGAPLAQVLDHICSRLALTQGAVAQVLGLSAPMLSHLVSGRRVKIGNPVAHTRLAQLRALADDVAAGRIGGQAVASAVSSIASATDTWAATTTTHAGPDSDAAVARRVQELFRHVADAADWLEVAAVVEGRHPDIAELLRVYGAGRVSSAQEHWRTTLAD